MTIGRDFLGFGGDKSPDKAPSRSQQKNRLEDLKATCLRQISENLLPLLRGRLAERLPKGLSWNLDLDNDNPDTLLLYYPAVASAAQYIKPWIKIELGARSDTEPSETRKIQAYIAESFPSLFQTPVFGVKTLSAERTFWEKAMLLHEETYRPADKPRKAQLARHYYDLWRLITHGAGARALADQALFERIATHRQTYFRWAWIDYSTLRKGTLRILPLPEQLPSWQQDYQSMRNEMFFGDVPPFDDILRVIEEFENRFNGKIL